MAEIDGNFIYLLKKFIIEQYGQDRFLELISETLHKETINGFIQSGKMLPNEIFEEFLEIINNRLGRKALEALSYKLGKKMISTFFGFTLRFVSLDKLLKNVQTKWNKAFVGGKLTLTETDDNHFKLLLTEFPAKDAFLICCEFYLKSWVEIAKKKEIMSMHRRIDASSAEYIFSY